MGTFTPWNCANNIHSFIVFQKQLLNVPVNFTTRNKDSNVVFTSTFAILHFHIQIKFNSSRKVSAAEGINVDVPDRRRFPNTPKWRRPQIEFEDKPRESRRHVALSFVRSRNEITYLRWLIGQIFVPVFSVTTHCNTFTPYPRGLTSWQAESCKRSERNEKFLINWTLNYK